MNKQEQINHFLESLGDFIGRYYSSAVTQVSKHSEGDWVKVAIEGPRGTTIELWSENVEVTVVFGESHWHIDSHDGPCNMEDIFENTIDSVIDILRFKTASYSCWREGRCLGGALCSDDVEEKDVISAARDPFKNLDEIRFQTWASELKTVEV
jgi:hypothetical protein